MSLSSGDLTTLVRMQLWTPGSGTGSNPLLSSLLIPDASRTILNKLNRNRLFLQTYVQIFDAVGNYQIVLPEYPVISVIPPIQMGAALIQPYPLPTPGTAPVLPADVSSFGGYGYRVPYWSGELPGDPSVVEFVQGVFYRGVQNVKITYQAGYVVQNESFTIPSGAGPFPYTALQPQGIWCQDNGVVYSNTGVKLTPTTTSPPPVGSYIPPLDPPTTLAQLGQYTFSSADAGRTVLITYSFVPTDLEMAAIQLASEMFSYRDRIGQLDKTLGGQETIRYLRGGIGRGQMFDLPPEVEARIWPYVSVISPVIGAPV